MPTRTSTRPPVLRISADLTLPPDTVTQSIALLAVRGAGKSNAAVVLAEELHTAGLPWVAVDPKGDYWGLRSSADGTGPGLPVPVFGGLHGDLPLEPEAGALLAELVVEENLTCVLDVSEFASKAAQIRFLTDFAERLFRLHGRHPQPRHLILEEADEYLPQRVMRDQARCVGAWTRVVKQGRSRGLGITLVSQRSAVVNKDALTQAETLIAMRTTAPQDRRAILEWVDYHAVARKLVESLPSLTDGEAWVCSPHWLGTVQRIRFRRRATFDSGATPTTLGRSRTPATIADIDLAALRERMAGVVEHAAQTDPAVLRRRIGELERALAAAAGGPPGQPVVERVPVEVPVLDEQLAGAAVALAGAAEQCAEALAAVLAGLSALGDRQAELQQAAAATRRAVEQARARQGVGAGHPRPPAPSADARTRRPAPHQPPAPAWPAGHTPAKGDPGRPPAGEGAPNGLPRAQRAILTVLAQFPQGRTKRQLALLTGYASSGGGFNNALGALRTAGLIERGEPIRATAAGVAALGGTWEPLPTGPALLDYWLGQLGARSAAAKILTLLVEVWPAALTKEEVAARTEYAVKGGGFNNALGRLRTLQLIDGREELRADETLAGQVRGTAA